MFKILMDSRNKNIWLCILVILVVFVAYRFVVVEPNNSDNHSPSQTGIKFVEDNIPSVSESKPADAPVNNATYSHGNILSYTAIQRNGGKWMSVLGACDPRKTFMRSTVKCNGKESPIFIHDPKTDFPISQRVIENGTFESGLIQGILYYLNNDTTVPFVDIGANIGVFSLSVALMGYRVISVEPQMRNVERICKSVTVGGFRGKLTIVHNALSDSRSEVQLFNQPRTFGSTQVRAKQANSKDESVEAILLDDLLEIFKFGKKVVMKVDVEGFEHKVLLGGTNFFDKIDVPVVCMEFYHHTQRKSGQVIIDYFMERGYKAFKAFKDVHRPGEELDPVDYKKWPVNLYWVKQ